MNPNDYQPRQSAPTDAEWFNTISSPNEPHASQKPSRKKIFLVIIVIATLIVASISAYFLTRTDPSVITGVCLDKKVYANFVSRLPSDHEAVKETELKPETAFYSHDLYFESDSPSLDETSQSDIKTIASAMATLYKESGERSAVVITLSASYVEESDRERTETRIAAVESLLLEANVPANRIVILKPGVATNEDDYAVDGAPLTLSMSARASCL